MLNDLKFSSVFNSIQGEGINCGKYTTFVRMFTEQCFPTNSFCEFCDTIFRDNYNNSLNFNDVRDFVAGERPNMITITGGEPLSIKPNDFIEFVKILKIYTNYIEIETNGSWLNHFDLYQLRELKKYINQFNISPKLNNSGVNFDYKSCFYNFDLIKDRSIFKFVVSENNFDNDIDEIKEWKDELSLNNNVWLMPLTPYNNNFEKKLFDFCTKMKYNYSPRIHINVFGYNFEKEI